MTHDYKQVAIIRDDYLNGGIVMYGDSNLFYCSYINILMVRGKKVLPADCFLAAQMTAFFV